MKALSIALAFVLATLCLTLLLTLVTGNGYTALVGVVLAQIFAVIGVAFDPIC